MLAGSRFFIKQVFDTALRLNAQPVFIFGAGAVGQATLKAISQDRSGKLKAVAFIDDDPDAIIFFKIFHDGLERFIFKTDQTFFPAVRSEIVYFGNCQLPVFYICFMMRLQGYCLFRKVL